jgi:hypothetical protein
MTDLRVVEGGDPITAQEFDSHINDPAILTETVAAVNKVCGILDFEVDPDRWLPVRQSPHSPEEYGKVRPVILGAESHTPQLVGIITSPRFPEALRHHSKMDRPEALKLAARFIGGMRLGRLRNARLFNR